MTDDGIDRVGGFDGTVPTGGGMTGQPEQGYAPGGLGGPGGSGGEYDADATMHVPFETLAAQYPDLAAMPPDADPLAAPGHGYTPPPLTGPGGEAAPAQQPTAGAAWHAPATDTDPAGFTQAAGTAPADASAWHQADAAQADAGWTVPAASGADADETGAHQADMPSASVMPESAGPAPGTPASEEAAGHWMIPFTTEDVSDESGEYSVGAPASTPVATPAPDPSQQHRTQPGAPAAPVDHVARPVEPNGERVDEPHGEAEVPHGDDPHSEHPTASYVLHVNGTDRPVTDAWLGESLLYVLRERLGLAGAKDGCEQGECGACSVQVDGRLIASCLTPAAVAAGCEIRTVEGLGRDGQPSDVQRALAESGAVQCGFCLPGMAMTIHDLLEGNHRPSDLETRQALCGNLCRCSGYRGALDAVREVAAAREAAAAAEAASGAPADGTAEAEAARIPHQSSGQADGGTA